MELGAHASFRSMSEHFSDDEDDGQLIRREAPTVPAKQTAASTPMLLPCGTRIDQFEVMRLLGRGGMGEVYLARDTKLGRKVALKLVRPEQLGVDPELAVERFLFEARATAQFSHPNIVTIYAVGEHCGHPYVALEYLQGQSLRERLLRSGARLWSHRGWQALGGSSSKDTSATAAAPPTWTYRWACSFHFASRRSPS